VYHTKISHCGPQVPVTNYLIVLYPYIYYIIVKVYNTLFVPLFDNERKSNKNASSSTKLYSNPFIRYYATN